MTQLNQERETHINMDRTSDKMRIYTSEHHVMRKLDKYVEESDDWNIIEIGRCKGEVVSKTYEAPRKLLNLRKKSFVMSEEQREAAAERLRIYHHKNDDKNEETSKEFDDDDNLDEAEDLDDDDESVMTMAEEDHVHPERSKTDYGTEYIREEMFEPIK